MIKKSLSLRESSWIQTAVYTAALNNVLKVKIRLSMTNDVYFFAVQFSIILGAKIRK